MICASSNFGAGCIKDSRDQMLKKNLCALYLSASLREKLWDGSEQIVTSHRTEKML